MAARLGGAAGRRPACDRHGSGTPALAALTRPARTAWAAGQGPRSRDSASSPSAGWTGLGPKRDTGMRRSPEPGAEGPGHSLPRISRVPDTRRQPMALTDPWSGEDDDTDYDYYDTPSGNIWRPGAGPGQPPAANPGGRAAGPLPGREAAAGVRPGGSRRLSPSLIVRTWHHRPGRGSVCPDKETP